MISQELHPHPPPAEPFRPFFDRHPEPMWIVDGATGTILSANDASVRVFGFARAAMAGARMSYLCPGAGDDLPDGTRFFCRADGEPVEVDVSSYAVEFLGRPARVVLARDLTGERRAQRALEESERRFRAAMQYAPIGMAIVGLDGRWLEVNRAVSRITGYSEAELHGLTFQQITHPDDLYADLAHLGTLLEGSQDSYEMEKRYIRKDGSEVWILLTASLVRTAQGAPLHFISQIQDISERRQAQAALARSEARFRSLTEHATDIITLLDAAGVILYQSPSVLRVTGYCPTELVGRAVLELVHPDDVAVVSRVLTEPQASPGEPVSVELRVRHRDGGWRTLEACGVNRLKDPAVHALVVNSRDITDRRAAEAELHMAEEQLRQSQKMEAVGRLAGGVAHDFNNLLTAIQGNVEMLLMEVPPAGPLYDDLLEIKHASIRAATLTRQLLAFSRRQMLAPKVVDLNAVVRELERMLGRVIGEDVLLETVLRPFRATVMADPGQLEQVVLNLAVNARDAMPRGGTLRIETREVILGAAQAQRDLTRVEPGTYVRLTVSDTGVGMPPEVVARVFEPFFTTKEPGKGTGLGLSTVYGIVRQSGGHVRVESEPGKGSTFRVFLPRVNADPEPSAADARAQAGPGHGVVLLVEDEEGVRSLSRRILQRSGYTVLAARDAAEARQLFAANGGQVDLLLTDVVMPLESGRELAEALQQLQPDLRVVFMSGYTDDALIRHGLLEETVRLLEKPFAPDALVRMVHEAMEV